MQRQVLKYIKRKKEKKKERQRRTPRNINGIGVGEEQQRVRRDCQRERGHQIKSHRERDGIDLPWERKKKKRKKRKKERHIKNTKEHIRWDYFTAFEERGIFGGRRKGYDENWDGSSLEQ